MKCIMSCFGGRSADHNDIRYCFVKRGERLQKFSSLMNLYFVFPFAIQSLTTVIIEGQVRYTLLLRIHSYRTSTQADNATEATEK